MVEKIKMICLEDLSHQDSKVAVLVPGVSDSATLLKAHRKRRSWQAFDFSQCADQIAGKMKKSRSYSF